MKNRKSRVTSPRLLYLSPVAVVAFFIFGCERATDSPQHMPYVCTVHRVEGTFRAYSSDVRNKRPMVKMYRWDGDQRREFMFPRINIVSCERVPQ